MIVIFLMVCNVVVCVSMTEACCIIYVSPTVLTNQST